MSEGDEDEKERSLHERKLDIARRLVENVEFPKIRGQTKIRRNVALTDKEARYRRTLKLITNPNYQQLYSMTLERKLMTESSLGAIIEELQGIASRRTHARIIATALREALKRSLFGCEVNVALCTDASATQLEFIPDASGYIRNVVRGQSICFECIDQNDVVLQVISKSEQQTHNPHITSGDAVVYVPLMGAGGGVGVVEIHGLHNEDMSDLKQYERPVGALKAMITAKDFRFKETVKLWRVPSARSGGTILNEAKTTGITMYNVVCGIITLVAFEKNGVPYVGGARYTLCWEDGLVEEAVSGFELLKVYVHTPQSLGCGTALDEHLVENLLKLGRSAGLLIEAQRTRDVVGTLRKQIFQPDLTDTDVCEITLDAIGTVISGIRVTHLLAFNPTKNEGVSLIVKFPSARTIDRALKNSVSDVVRACMQSTSLKDPIFLDDNANLEWVAIEIPVASGYTWPREPHLTRYFCALIRYKSNLAGPAAAELRYFCEMVSALSESLGVLFASVLRARHRKDLIKSIEEQLYEWRHLPAEQVSHNALQVASAVLPDPTSMYVGILQQGANAIQFIASNKNSSMVGKTLRRGQGVSFEVMESGKPVVLRESDVDKKKVLIVGAIVDVLYGKVYYRAKIIAVRGHELFDVYYDEDKVTETAVSMARIRPVNSAFRTHKFGPIELPFVSIPLRHRTKGLGVLNVDNFSNVPKAPYDLQPEEGLINFLDKLGRIIGTTLDTQAKKLSLKAFATVCRSVTSNINEILHILSASLTANLHYLSSILAVQIPTDDIKADQSASNQKIFRLQSKKVRGIRIFKAATILYSLGDVPADVKAALNTFDPTKFHLKPVQPRGDNCVWMVCKLRSLDKQLFGKLFIVAITQRIPFNDPDMEYLQILQKVLIEGLQSLDVRKARGEIRFEALAEIKQICLRWNTMDRHSFFAAVMEQIEMCFFSANMYVGKVGMFNNEIRYFLASRLSNMKGQVLKRIMQDGISFSAVDEMVRIFVHQKSTLAHTLHHFGPKEQFEYPFVVIPIIAHIDAVIAVLGVDACDDPISESERHESIVSFFGTVASQISEPIRGYCAQDARAELDKIAQTAKTYRDGVREIKRVILSMIPFATRVAEVVYEPKEILSFRDGFQAVSLDEYIVHVRILELEALSKTAPAALLECYWNGGLVFKSKFKGDADFLPFTLHIPKGILLSHVSFQMVIKGGNSKELCRKSLGFHYFVNTPVYAIDHLFDNASQNIADTHLAKITLVSKMYKHDELINYTINTISGSELSSLENGELPDPNVRIYLNSLELGRTTSLSKTVTPVWNDEQICIPLGTKLGSQSTLAIEIWDEDFQGRINFLGRVEIPEKELVDSVLAAEMGISFSAGESGGHSLDGASTRSILTLKSTPSSLGMASRLNSGLSKMGSTIKMSKKFEKKGSSANSSFLKSMHKSSSTLAEENSGDGTIPALCYRLEKHPTMAPYLQTFVDGNVSITGTFTRAHEMTTQQILEALNVKIIDRNTVALEAESSVASSSSELFSTELIIVAARDLIMKSSYSGTPEAVINPFAVVCMNGEEVGRTGTILQCTNPIWEDEKFVIKMSGRDPASNILSVEVFHLGDHGKATLLGSVTITGGQLLSLLTGTRLRSWWFDIRAKENATLEQTFFRGQLRLAGHPVKVDIAGQELDPTPSKKYEMTLVSATNLFTESKTLRYIATVAFNGVMIFQTQAYSETGTVKWNNERFSFWQTGNILLDNSELVIEFWPLDRSGTRIVDRLAVIQIRGADLKRLFSAPGCVSTWVPVVVPGKRDKKGPGAGKSECMLRTGPEGGKDQLLEDGKELFITILAGCGLALRTTGSRSAASAVKANPYCMVSWNGRVLGRTKVVENTLDPIWQKQRFCFRLPAAHGDDDVVSGCVLRIDVYDKADIGAGFETILSSAESSTGTKGGGASVSSKSRGTSGPKDTLMGSVVLSDSKLKAFINSGVVKTTWLTVTRENVTAFQERLDKAAAISQRAIYGELKVRAGGIGEAEDPTATTLVDYKLDIISCLGLGQSDAFKKSNPYVVVEWMHKERGRTRVVKDSSSPEFHESFLMRIPPDKTLQELTLTISVWSNKEKYQDDFLGCVTFSDGQLVSLFNRKANDKQAFKLVKSGELTEDENSYVQGNIYLNGSPVVVEETSSIINHEAILIIDGAKDLSRCNLYGSCIDCYCIVYFSSRIENGGIERELHRTHAVSNSLDPTFSDESIVIFVPLDEDWSGVRIRIEVWELGNDFLGSVTLEGVQLRELLNRYDEEVFVQKKYFLQHVPNLTEDQQLLVRGELVLSGGIKADVDRVKAKRAEKSVKFATARMTTIYDEAGAPGQIHLHSSKKLGKADAVSGKSNPFCRVLWNGKLLGKSEVVYSTVNPKWDLTYDIKLPARNNFERCLLEIEIWHWNSVTNEKGDFLGMVSLTGSALSSIFATAGKKDVAVALKEMPTLNAKQNKLVSGTILLSGTFEEEAEEKDFGNAKFTEALSFELNVAAATNLSQIGEKGKPPDSFVAVYWLNPSKPTMKTKVITAKSNPSYNEVFVLEKPAGTPLSHLSLRLVVYNKNTLSDNDFLGQIVFTSEALEVFVTEGEGRYTTFDLEQSESLPDAKQTYVRGCITISTKLVPGKRTEQGVGKVVTGAQSEKVVPKDMKQMEVTILAASGLPKANLFGLSDPYCVVKWGSAEVGKTSTIKETCDPLWDGDETFIFNAPIELGRKERKSVRDSKRETMLQTNLVVEGSGEADQVSIREKVAVLMKSTEKLSRRQTYLASTKGREDDLALTVEVYDWNRVGNGIFLGSLELSGDALHEFVHGDRMKRQWFDLGRSTKIPPDEQKLVKSTGNPAKIELLMGPHDFQVDGRDIELIVCEAKGLAKVDTFGYADPYVKVRFNNRLIGKTEPMKRTLNPVWEGEVFSLRLPISIDFVDCILYLEVWDWNLTTTGNFLGCVKISGHDLQHFVEGSHMAETWFDLQKSEYLPMNLQGYVQGSLALKAGFQGVHDEIHLANLQKYEIGVLSATGLSKADTGLFGSTDPFIILKLNGKEVGRTPHVTKSLNPTWDHQEFPIEVDISNAVANELTVEIWNHTLVSKSESLGYFSIVGQALIDLLLSGENSPILASFDLVALPVKGDKKLSSTVKGKVELSVAKIHEEAMTTVDGPNVRVTWSEDRIIDAGNPTLELSILRADNLMIAKTLSNTSDPFCVITWNGQEVGTTAVAKGTNPIWSHEYFSMKFDPTSEAENAVLLIEVYDSETLRKGTFLGKVYLQFWSLIRLTDGEFTLPLDCGDKSIAVRGTLTFKLRIMFPYWDSFEPHIPMIVRRNLKVFSGNDFTKISGELPNTKCIMSYNGTIKIKTTVTEKDINPVWQAAQCEILVDSNVPSDVHVEVYHVDFVDQKEICIGEVDIPFEYLVRPPLEPFDVFLGPPQKVPPKKYRFGVSGSVHVQVIDAEKNVPDSHISFGAFMGKHLSSVSVDDCTAARRQVAGSEDALFDGLRLTEEQLLWLGTQYDLTSVRTLGIQKEWITIPMRDIGFRTGVKFSDFVGMKPGCRFALCVQRSPTRINFSDAALIADIEESIQKCLLHLRRKQIYATLRTQIMEKYRRALEDVVKMDILDNEFLCNWLNKAVMMCIPGCKIRLTKISSDQSSLKAELYDSPVKAVAQIVLIPGQGFDWQLVGRHPPKSLVIRNVQDLANKKFLTVKPFPNVTFPMIYIPFLAGDVSTAFFTVENWDIYKGGVGNNIDDEDDVKKWLEEMGNMFGEAMFVGKEKYALSLLEKSYLFWNSSIAGLLHSVITRCLEVLQACRLMEVWSISSTQSIRSLLGKASDNQKLGGRILIIKTILCKPGKKSVFTDLSRRLGLEDDDHEDSETIMSADPTIKTSWILGIRYDEMEQSQLAEETQLDPNSQEYLNSEPGSVTSIFKGSEVTVYITNERNIFVSLYEVDKHCNILQEFSGRVSFQTLQESSLKTNLSPLRKGFSIGTFDAELTLHWPKPDVVGPVVDVSFIARRLRSLTLTIKRCAGLQPIPDSKFDPSAYCEVFWGKKLIGKTAVKKDTTTPIWNQSFSVPYKKQQFAFAVDVYDFSILGRGAFFGRIEIPFEQLCFPAPGEIDMPLKHKLGLNASKQKYIGGILTVEVTTDMKELLDHDQGPEDELANPTKAVASTKVVTKSTNALASIPRSIFQMENPALQLTIACASDLSKANLFGGSSDPYCLIYSSTAKDPLFRTTVIENNLDPVWNETFLINFGLSLIPDTTTIKDFPDIIIEVWDYNRVAKSVFLGRCVVTPMKYFQAKSGDFPLGASPALTEKENKLANGVISVRMRLIDNTSTIGAQKYHLTHPYRCLNSLAFLEVYILRCKDLMVVNKYIGKSNPFVKVIWNGRSMETGYVKNNLNPSWNHEKFTFNLSTAGCQMNDLILQVWDKNFFSESQFMGEVRIPAEQMLHPKHLNQEIKLRNFPGLEQENITGSIVFKLSVKYQAQRVELKPSEFTEAKISFPAPVIMDVTVARDPEEERKRQLYEKSKFPGLIVKAKEQTDRYLSNPFNRVGLISEVHFGQVVAACQRAEHTVLRTDLADICCIPTAFNGPEGNAFAIVSRYETSKLPRRDVQFLTKVRQVMNDGIQLAIQRQQRSDTLKHMVDKLRSLQETIKDSPEEFALDAIPVLESSWSCPIGFYLLGSDGKTLYHCDRITGKADLTGTVNTFAKLAAKICRHGLIIQSYRGEISVVDLKWDHVSQRHAIPLAVAAEEIELVEDPGICVQLRELGATSEPDGYFAVPMIAESEIFVGLVVIQEVNKLPSALYKVSKAKARSNALMPSNFKLQADAKEKLEEVEWAAPEAGTVETLRNISGILGSSICHSRMVRAGIEMSSFVVGPDTPLMDIVRFWIRQIALALPTVREVAIWGVDLRSNEMSKSRKMLAVANNEEKKPRSRFAYLLSFFSRSKKKSTEVSQLISNFETAELNRSPPITAGYFLEEDPTALLATPVERKRFNSTKGAEKEDRYRRNAIQAVRIHKHIVQHAIEQVETNKLDWMVCPPSCFTEGLTPVLISAEGLHQADGSINHVAGSIDDNASIGDSSLITNGSSLGSGSVKTTIHQVFGGTKKKEFGPVHSEFMELVTDECIRCTEVLKKNVFRVSTDHWLCSIANIPSSKAALDDIFDPNYSKRKAEYERDRQLLLFKKFELEGKRRERLRQKKNAKLAEARITAAAQAALDLDGELAEERLSDISDEDEIDLISEANESDDDSFDQQIAHPHHHSSKFAMVQHASSRMLGSSWRASSNNFSSSKVNPALPGTSNTSYKTAQGSRKAFAAVDSPSVKVNTMFQAPLPGAPPPIPEGPPPNSDEISSRFQRSTSESVASARSSSNPGTPARSVKSGDRNSLVVEIADGDQNSLIDIGSIADASSLTGGSLGGGSNSISRAGSEKKSKKLTFSVDSFDNSPQVAASPAQVGSIPPLNTASVGQTDKPFTDLSSRTLQLDEPAHQGLAWKYFIAVLQHGYGGQTGWGVSGPLITKFLEEMSGYLDNALQQFVHVRHEKRLKEAEDEVNRLLQKKIQREKKASRDEFELPDHAVSHDIHTDAAEDDHVGSAIDTGLIPQEGSSIAKSSVETSDGQGETATSNHHHRHHHHHTHHQQHQRQPSEEHTSADPDKGSIATVNGAHESMSTPLTGRSHRAVGTPDATSRKVESFADRSAAPSTEQSRRKKASIVPNSSMSPSNKRK